MISSEEKLNLEQDIAALQAKLAELEKRNRQLESNACESKVVRIEIQDLSLKKRVDSAFEKLESYFPEHKVFALDSLDGTLREQFSELYKAVGYESVKNMFEAYGYEIITGMAVKELKGFVEYTPGNEPDIIKSKVEAAISLLEKYYPNHIIERSLQSEHKKLSQKVSGLYQWLGYDNAGDFLNAYGFEYLVGVAGEGGRPEIEVNNIINTLLEKYKDKEKPKTIGDLMYDNPELKSNLKTLQNRAKELFGMTLKDYFIQLGLFVPKAREKGETIQILAKNILEERYNGLDSSLFGTFEEALKKLDGFVVKYRKTSEEICIYQALTCGETVEIPYGIDHISSSAFENNNVLKTLILPSSVKSIKENAFSGCSSLETIKFSEGLEIIENSAFRNCSCLNGIILPETLQVVEEGAFGNCSKLSDVVILNERMFADITAFEGCAFEYKRTEINSTDVELFDYTIVKRNSVKINKFLGSNIEHVIIPAYIDNNMVTTIAPSAFEGNTSIKTISMPNTISKLGGSAFKGCTGLTEISLSNNIDKLVSNTFMECTSLTKINIPDGVTEIKKGIFKHSPLEELYIGANLKALESRCFYNGKINNITGKQESARNIKNVMISLENPYLCFENGCVMSHDKSKLFAVLQDSSLFIIPDGVRTICDYAFYDLVKFNDIQFADSVIDICSNAFRNSNLRSVVFGASLEVIGEKAFYNNEKLSSVVFNSKIKSIEYRAFSCCSIPTIHLPSSIEHLGEGCIRALDYDYWYDSYQNVIIENGGLYHSDGNAIYKTVNGKKELIRCFGREFFSINELFNPYTYEYTINTVSYEVEQGTNVIASKAFVGCSNLGKIIIPEGVEIIEDLAFNSCRNLSEIILPYSLKRIGEKAFYDTSLKYIHIPKNVCEISNSAFGLSTYYGYEKESELNISVDAENELYFVENNCLYLAKDGEKRVLLLDFSNDETISIAENVCEISDGAFINSKVIRLRIPSSVVNIGEGVFDNASKLKFLSLMVKKQDRMTIESMIYLPYSDVNQMYEYDYSAYQCRKQIMDCIRNVNGELFDYQKYDSIFEYIESPEEKILVASNRIDSSYNLIEEYETVYAKFLAKNYELVIKTVSKYNVLPLLISLINHSVFEGVPADIMIAVATKYRNRSVISFLRNYYGMSDKNLLD